MNRSSPDIVALADRIDATKRSWLPIAGHVVNVTLNLAEADMITAALRSHAVAATPSTRDALEKMVALYESEYDADTPFKRPDWLIAALSGDAAQPRPDLLLRARQFVADAGCDEDDSEVNAARNELLAEMDTALSSTQREIPVGWGGHLPGKTEP